MTAELPVLLVSECDPIDEILDAILVAVERLPSAARASRALYEQMALLASTATSVDLDYFGQPLSSLRVYIDDDLLPEECVMMTATEEREWAAATGSVV